MLFSSSSKSSYLYIVSGTNRNEFFSIYLILLKSRRWISLHEYQSKKILNENNLNVQRFQVVETPDEAKRAGEELSMN
jgi:hypothetical protein